MIGDGGTLVVEIDEGGELGLALGQGDHFGCAKKRLLGHAALEVGGFLAKFSLGGVHGVLLR